MAQQPPVQNDIALLLPAYIPYVKELLEALSKRGLKPRLFETLRTKERCAWLKRKGTSKSGVLSMHRYGAAVDIIDQDLLWDNPAFFKALGEEAQKLNLTWGGDWDSNPKTPQSFDDRPHVQAIPIWKQAPFRNLPDDEARNAALLEFFKKEPLC